ncbi:MAG: nucleotide exchange factor GrpE [Acidobacteria bacterium]|nr:nucleotide exchange factor GrpE [Acidobacteriota bacterium]
MPTRPRKPTDPPEARGPGEGEEEPIEILEVVGVDEATGAVKEEAARGTSAPGMKPAAPGSDDGARERLLEEALREKDRFYDLLLRKQAEFENYRKRTERERDETGAVAARDVLKRLLPVLDNMERALKTGEGSRDPLRQGIELVHQQFLDLLRKEGIQPIDALGSAFDPRLHEAVEVLDVAGFEPDVVLEEMQRGYTHNDRLLRPALVKVSSGKGPKERRGRKAGEDT